MSEEWLRSLARLVAFAAFASFLTGCGSPGPSRPKLAAHGPHPSVTTTALGGTLKVTYVRYFEQRIPRVGSLPPSTEISIDVRVTNTGPTEFSPPLILDLKGDASAEVSRDVVDESKLPEESKCSGDTCRLTHLQFIGDAVDPDLPLPIAPGESADASIYVGGRGMRESIKAGDLEIFIQGHQLTP